MSQFGWLNCPAEVRAQVECLSQEILNKLSDNLLGVYLHGSLASGCFNPLRSDIDLLVATRGKIPLKDKRALAQSLLDVSMQPAPVEISFLTIDDLHSWRHPAPYDFHYSEDWREIFGRELANGDWQNWNSEDRFDVDLAAHITVLNHRGFCLYGRPVADIFPRVPEKDFIDSILADVLSVKYGLGGTFEIYPVYIVLNACRTLAFLQTGRVMSKDEGGKWALENLPAKYCRTIRGALAEYRDGRNQQSCLPKKSLAAFAAYIKNKIEQAKI